MALAKARGPEKTANACAQELGQGKKPADYQDLAAKKAQHGGKAAAAVFWDPVRSGEESQRSAKARLTQDAVDCHICRKKRLHAVPVFVQIYGRHIGV